MFLCLCVITVRVFRCGWHRPRKPSARKLLRRPHHRLKSLSAEFREDHQRVRSDLRIRCGRNDQFSHWV
jgi:hypothetical protein